MYNFRSNSNYGIGKAVIRKIQCTLTVIYYKGKLFEKRESRMIYKKGTF